VTDELEREWEQNSQNLFGGTEKNHETFINHEMQPRGGDMNPIPPKYKAGDSDAT
jgi:hypothetical protein